MHICMHWINLCLKQGHLEGQMADVFIMHKHAVCTPIQTLLSLL